MHVYHKPILSFFLSLFDKTCMLRSHDTSFTVHCLLYSVPNDQIDRKLRELETDWEGQDVRNYELEALRHENQLNLDAGYQSGSGSMGYSNAAYRGDGYADITGNMAGMGTMGSMGSMGGGIEIERTRQINITTAASQLPEQEYIMEREFRQ